MNTEIMQQLDKIKYLFDQLPLVNDLLKLQNKVLTNKLLMSKIAEFRQFPNDNLKKEIYSDEDYLAYKHLENELYYLILQINQRLKRLTVGEKKCYHESN